MIDVLPPASEVELLERARGIAGSRLASIADDAGWIVPAESRSAKGWVGQLLEVALGATASTRPLPDFEKLGVELKTIPIDDKGQPKETTFVSAATLTDVGDWQDSPVRKKLARVLWIPVEAEASIPLGQRRIGSPLLWSPSTADEEILKADFEELAGLIALGFVESITAERGRWLHIRPKAKNAAARTWGEDDEGDPMRTLPRGYYLRRDFTKMLLDSHFVRGRG